MPIDKLKHKKEKRSFPRFESYIPVSYRVLDDQKSVESLRERRDKAECVMTTDMSRGGMRFVGSSSLKTGKYAQLKFKIPNRDGLFKAFIKVAWTDGACGGLKFILIDNGDRDRIKSYLEKIISA